MARMSPVVAVSPSRGEARRMLFSCGMYRWLSVIADSSRSSRAASRGEGRAAGRHVRAPPAVVRHRGPFRQRHRVRAEEGTRSIRPCRSPGRCATRPGSAPCPGATRSPTRYANSACRPRWGVGQRRTSCDVPITSVEPDPIDHLTEIFPCGDECRTPSWRAGRADRGRRPRC